MKLGGWVRCVKISPEFEFGGQRSKPRSGTKNKKVRFFRERSSGARLYASGKISACCLVSLEISLSFHFTSDSTRLENTRIKFLLLERGCVSKQQPNDPATNTFAHLQSPQSEFQTLHYVSKMTTFYLKKGNEKRNDIEMSNQNIIRSKYE